MLPNADKPMWNSSRDRRRAVRKQGAVLLILFLSLVIAAPGSGVAAMTSTGGWLPNATSAAPAGQRFLGAFEAREVMLTVAELPAHTQITLRFDFYAILTWDGNAGEDIGPDIFRVTHSGDQPLFQTTFSNYVDQPQAYPGTYPGASNPGLTGATAINTLGYRLDSVYPLTFTFAHTGPVLQVKFAASGLQPDGDETWGLDNVVIEADGQVAYTFDAESDNSGPVVEVAQLLAADHQADDTLGTAVAVHEDLLAVGAPATVADNMLDQNQRAGALYLFTHNPAGLYTWEQTQKLTPGDGAPNDRFGTTVALDANLLAVGAPWADIGSQADQGAVYLFARNQADPNHWDALQKLVAPDGAANDRFGRALALSDSSLLIGAKEKAYLFYRGGDEQWYLAHTFIASDGKEGDRYGDSVALAGDLVLIGASGAQIGEHYLQGAAYLYQQAQGGVNNWGEVKKLTAPDGDILTFFGYPVLLANHQAFIGGAGKQQVYVFDQHFGGVNTWAEVQRLTSMAGRANADFGSRLAYHNGRLLIGAGSQGELFERADNSVLWLPLRRLQGAAGSGTDFTSSLALWDNLAFVGTPGASSPGQSWHGAVYLFDVTRPTAPTVRFSWSEYLVQENVGPALLKVLLDRPSPYPLSIAYETSTVDHEALPGEDYTPVSGTLTIATGHTKGVFNVWITNDNRLELTERFNVSLGQVTGGLWGEPRETVMTILDDDAIGGACDYVAHDEESLDRAIRCLYVAAPGPVTIQVTDNISLTRPLPLLTSPQVAEVRIEGNGYTIDAQGHGRVLAMYKIKVAISDLTLRGGRIPQENAWPNPNYGGGLYADTPNIGFGIEPSCALTLTNVVITDNEAYMGGGLYYGCELPLQMTDSTVSNNRAVVGGAFSTAGGEEFFTNLFINRSTFSSNVAQENGGAFDLSSGDGGVILELANSTVSSNRVISGTGGGLWITQASHDGRSETHLINSTVVNNEANQGSGVFNRYGILRMSNSLIADNRGGSNCVYFTSEDGNGQMLSHGYNLDSDGSCLLPAVRQPSDIPSGQANLGPLADHGGATLTHALLEGSAAIDAANNAVCLAAPVNGVDQRGNPRPQGARCDIGAFEGVSDMSVSNLLFVSSSSSGRAGAVKFRDEDIVAYAFATATWQMVFDGSDVGITKDVDAFAFRPDGSLLLSFNAPTDVPGLGQVDDSDIVQFTPTTLGSSTAGSFVLYLRGADVGLTTDGEDIDAISFTVDGNLVVSTIGDFAVTNLTGKDEDLIQLDDQTTGAWSLFLDGSTVGLANEDVNGLWIDPATGQLYLTVKDSFAFTNKQGEVKIDANDIFVCTPTAEGGCTYGRFWDSDDHDYSAHNLDSIGLGVLPPSFVPGVQASDITGATPDELTADDDIDDFNLEELIYPVYLPLVKQ